jgi:N-methylhydantoinase B
VSSIADVERNEQVSPLFYLYRRLACDTGGAGRHRGGVSGEVALTLGGIRRAEALVMTHGAEVPNSMGLSGGWPGSTVQQSMGRGAIRDERPVEGRSEAFGPKPGLMDMTCEDLFRVTWQGGGGWGDPLERDPQAVARDVRAGRVSAQAATTVYGVAMRDGEVDAPATDRERRRLRLARVGRFTSDPERFLTARAFGSIGEALFLARDHRGVHVVSRAGCILATGSTRWRAGAVAKTFEVLPPEHRIRLHEGLAVTLHFCPASGTLLSVDVHERGHPVPDDIVLDKESLERLEASGSSRPSAATQDATGARD